MDFENFSKEGKVKWNHGEKNIVLIRKGNELHLRIYGKEIFEESEFKFEKNDEITGVPIYRRKKNV